MFLAELPIQILEYDTYTLGWYVFKVKDFPQLFNFSQVTEVDEDALSILPCNTTTQTGEVN